MLARVGSTCVGLPDTREAKIGFRKPERSLHRLFDILVKGFPN